MRVVVIGGGPAGASAAGLLAQQGVRTLVLEKARFPRHHVGESLQPASLELLDRHLGLGPALRSQGFANKFGAVYVWGESREPWSVLFDERLERSLPQSEAALLEGGYESALQVDRARFDQLLLRAAEAQGAEVREGVEVRSVRLDGERGVELTDGSFEEADLVLDASGQRCLVGRQQGTLRMVQDLRCSATYAYVEGAGGVPGVLGRHVQWVVTVPEGWAWFIPISATRTSVGLVCKERGLLPAERFWERIEEAFPCSREQLDGELRFARDWSFTNTAFCGEGYALLGDAACFVDPILSGGVDFAVRSGFAAATSALTGDWSSYEDGLRRQYKAYLRLARYWYGNNRSVDGFFWQAHREIPAHATATPLRAFVYLTTGRYAAERHLKVFQRWQEEKMFKALGVDAAELERARKGR
jgi:halogenation protein CepH